MVKSPNGDIYASLDAANEFLSNMKYCFLLGLDVDGIYRVSGNLAVIQKLRFAVNHGKSTLPAFTPSTVRDCEN
jgi:hypothetical protein